MEEVDYSLPAGTLISEFRIIDILGVGGFGITYKAQDTRLDRFVAIKEFLPVELAARGSDNKTVMPRTNVKGDYQYGLSKFLDEAKTLAKFNHPNIVKVLTFLKENGTAYLVMEFVEGEALDAHLKKIHFNGNMAESRIREIIEPLLKGLAQVHKTGLLHRDIKPGNIYLQSSSDASNEHGNNPMLIDFGAARQSVGEKSKSISSIISQGYAPPEQYTTRGKQGAHTDIYAVGAVMYYLVTGEKPIESTDRQHEIMDELPDPLKPIEKNRSYSNALINAITQAMILRVSNRTPNVTVLQQMLSDNTCNSNNEKNTTIENEHQSQIDDSTVKIKVSSTFEKQQVVEPVKPSVLIEPEAVESVKPSVLIEAEAVEPVKPSVLIEAEVVEPVKPSVLKEAEAVEPVKPSVLIEAEVVEPVKPSVLIEAEAVESAKPSVLKEAEAVEPVKPSVLKNQQISKVFELSHFKKHIKEDVVAYSLVFIVIVLGVIGKFQYQTYLNEQEVITKHQKVRMEQLIRSQNRKGDELLWDRAVSTGYVRIYNEYLVEYPRGIHIEEVKKWLLENKK
ncbi:MAG: protein kinase [Colwellia sp.]|nr:protein kinase [Colwellia sp.]